jgi:UDP-N-acetylmuramoyl-L-alanyl-D-glutamate--2,6-diaminopimelate ligase
VYNALAAAGAAHALAVPALDIARGLGALIGVPGRMEKVPADPAFTILVDFAHTGDALLNVLRTIHGTKPRHILTVFGCGGERDRKKRPIMGRIAVQQSHHVWITLDNPRHENQKQIMDDILSGIRVTGKKNYTVIYDRRDAVKAALAQARVYNHEGDVVLLAGKGHEQYQIIGDRKFPYNDKRTVIELLKR